MATISKVNQFKTRYGLVTCVFNTYTTNGNLSVQLVSARNGEPIATLSSNVIEDSLPKDCFYMKDWSENAEIAEQAIASSLFELVPGKGAGSGHVYAELYRVKSGIV